VSVATLAPARIEETSVEVMVLLAWVVILKSRYKHVMLKKNVVERNEEVKKELSITRSRFRSFSFIILDQFVNDFPIIIIIIPSFSKNYVGPKNWDAIVI